MNASRLQIFLAISVIALASVACGGSASDSSGGSGSNSAGEFMPSSGANSPDASAAASDGAIRVIQNTHLGLAVEDLSTTFGRVTELARTHGGYVASADITNTREADRGIVTLRVPSVRLADLVSDLKGMSGAELRSERVETKEISAEYTDLESRLRNLQRTEAQYQQFLTQAKNIEEVLNVTNRLQSTRDEIERTQGRLNLLSNQVEYATVRLELSLLPAGHAAEGRSSPVEVFSEAWAVSTDVFWGLLQVGAAALVLIVWLVPLTMVWLIGSRLYRRYGAVLQRLR
jgi:hypothetical protein